MIPAVYEPDLYIHLQLSGELERLPPIPPALVAHTGHASLLAERLPTWRLLSTPSH